MMTAVVRVGSEFVASGVSGEGSWRPIVLRSLDGVAWTVDSHNFGSGGNLYDIAVTEWGLVVVGHTVNSELARAAVWMGTETGSWQRVSDGPEFDSSAEWHWSEARAVAVRGTQVLVGGIAPGPTLWVTNDGHSWDRVDLAERGTIEDVLALNDGWVAVGNMQTDDDTYGAIWISENGTTWHRATGLDATSRSQWLKTVAASDERIVVLGVPSIWTSTDANEWTTRSLLEPTERVQGVEDIIAYENVFYLVGFGQAEADPATDGVTSKGIVWASTDGETWEQVSDDDVFFPSGPDGWLIAAGEVSGETLLVVFGPDTQQTAIFTGHVPGTRP